MSDPTHAFVHQWFEEVWNQRSTEAVDRMLAPDASVHGLKDPDGREVCGPAGFLPVHAAFCGAFPDLHIDVHDCLVDGDRMAFRCLVRGTHLGDGIGLAPTGRTVEFTGLGIIRVADGKVVEAWNAFDFETMNHQIAGPATS